jgi:FAD/FMN-containing dehydrogenase
MDKIIQFDETNGVVIAESGVVLKDLNTYLGERGYEMPLDVKSRGLC